MSGLMWSHAVRPERRVAHAQETPVIVGVFAAVAPLGLTNAAALHRNQADPSEKGIKMQNFTQITSRRPVEQTFAFALLSGTRLSSRVCFPGSKWPSN